MNLALKERLEELRFKIESVSAELLEKSKQLEAVKAETLSNQEVLTQHFPFASGYMLGTLFDRAKDALVVAVTQETMDIKKIAEARKHFFDAKSSCDAFHTVKRVLEAKIKDGNQKITAWHKRIKELEALLAKHRRSVQFVKEAMANDAIMDTTP